MKLTKLKVHQYRDVVPGTELTFSPSSNLVLGDNGTGRTTLLELLSLVLASNFSGLIQEAFSLEYEVTLPGMLLHISVRNERSSATPEPERASPKPSALLRLRTPKAASKFEPVIETVIQLEAPASRLVVRGDSEGMSCEVDGQEAYSQSMHWSLLDRTVWILLFMVAQYLGPEVKERLKELLRRTFLLAPSRFDEGLGMYEHLGTIKYAMEMRGDEVFPLGLMALPTWMPKLLRERVERGLATDVIEIPHDEVDSGFLARFVTLAGFSSGTFQVELLSKRVFEDGGRVDFGRFGFRFTRRDGSVLSQDELSYGQKRLLSFLYYLDVNEDFVIADELANGLHPRLVEACVREMGPRQAFLTSQNPLLFDHIPLGSVAETRASLILCGLGLQDGRERRVWSNPTGEMAAKLFGAYQVGSTPLGALLRAQGLW